MKFYLKYVRPYWTYFLLAPLCMVAEVYCDVRIPALAADVVNIATAHSDVQEIVILTLKMLGIVCIAMATGIGAAFFATKASVNFTHDLREDVFSAIQRFSFFNIDKFTTGSLITRLTNDTNQLQQMVVMLLRMAFRSPGMLIGSLIMAFSINAKVSLIFLLLICAVSFVICIILKISYARFMLLQTKIDRLNTNVKEVLTNSRVIKALTRETFEENKFNAVNDDLKETTLSTFRVSILLMPLISLFVYIATIAIMWVGSKVFGLGEIELGDISAFITYLSTILMSIQMLSMIFMQGSRAFVSAQRIKEILEEKIDVSDENAKKIDKKVDSGSIRFENVSFKYFKNSEELVLNNLSFDIEPGQTIGIIGSTGCGKTSLVHLISRLYDVTEGAVYVDGCNVKDYSLKNLRDGISMVLQNNVLFSGSIKENLLWGEKNASKEDLKEAASFAQAYDFILEKDGEFDAEVLHGGQNFSGGQKQRLCIARALVKKGKILILDDSTSAVDTATEAKIREHFSKQVDVTKLIIAQRISSIVHADKILVLNDGRLEAIGNHKEVLEASKTYQEIYMSQVETKVAQNEQ